MNEAELNQYITKLQQAVSEEERKYDALKEEMVAIREAIEEQSKVHNQTKLRSLRGQIDKFYKPTE